MDIFDCKVGSEIYVRRIFTKEKLKAKIMAIKTWHIEDFMGIKYDEFKIKLELENGKEIIVTNDSSRFLPNLYKIVDIA